MFSLRTTPGTQTATIGLDRAVTPLTEPSLRTSSVCRGRYESSKVTISAPSRSMTHLSSHRILLVILQAQEQHLSRPGDGALDGSVFGMVLHLVKLQKEVCQRDQIAG